MVQVKFEKTLIQTEISSIVYGKFRDEENQELFRCPRKLDNVDLKQYINSNRYLLGFETDRIKDLHEVAGYLGYYRLYFRDGTWHGRWMEIKDADRLDSLVCYGVDQIIDFLKENFRGGCDYCMKYWLSHYPTYGEENRYLLKPLLSDHYKVMFDTRYGNEDYPCRIYVYE